MTDPKRDDIKVTAEMLMAGMKEFYRDRNFEADHEWVERIYCAMRRREKPNQPEGE